jgi:NTE family protein
MGRFARLPLFILVLLATVNAVFAAEEPASTEAASAQGAQSSAPSRPRIGLVLSGGGARGAAHVGVLKVIEELRIPIDAVAGTSMGAGVGGLYASGMSAAEVEHLLKSVDWQDSFSDRPPRRDLGFRRKQDDRNFLVRYGLGIKSDGFKLPKGLVQGQKLAQILRGATLPVAEISNFDRLPVPFRAVATDLETGAPVVMGNGDLVTAMRASMSAPGVFLPTERDGRMLVDGGLTHNLPVDVARQMGVDILIVVDVSFSLYSREEMTSPLDITNQAAAIMIRKSTLEDRAKLTDDDILIDPLLGSFRSTNFAQVDQARIMGELAARAATPRLINLSLDQEGYAAYLASRNPREIEAPYIDFVRGDPASARYESRVTSMLSDQVGKPLDKAWVERRISDLYALDLFETVDYSIVEDDGKTGLEFRLRRKSWGPNYIRFGLNLIDDFEGNSRYNVAARFIVTELNELGGEWLSDIQIGDNPRFFSEFYQPLAFTSRYFVAPNVRVESRNLEVRDAQERISVYRVRESEGGLDFGRELGDWGEWRLGVLRGNSSSRVRIGDGLSLDENSNNGGYFARVSYDKLDSRFFPRYGEQFEMQWTGQRENVGADRHSDRVSAGALVARSRGRNTLIFSANIGSTLNSDTFAQDYFTLGGFLNLSGLRPGELSGPHFGIGRLQYYRKVSRGGEGVLDVPLYAGFSVEAGNVWQQRDDARFGNLRKNGSVFLGADTILGPIYLGAGSDSKGESGFYLFLGRTF